MLTGIEEVVHMFKKILVAVDQSPHDQSVLGTAVEFAKSVHAEVRVLHVLETGFVGRAGAINLESSDGAHQVLNDAVSLLESNGLRVSGAVRAGMHGRLAVESTEEGIEFGAGLVIIGSRGLSNLEGIFVGSTSHRLIHMSKIPVLVVP